MTTPLTPERREQLARVAREAWDAWMRWPTDTPAFEAEAVALHAEIAGEYEARIEELTRDVDAHRRHREILATDLAALADGEPVTTMLAETVRLRIADLEATIAAERWIPTAERLPEVGEEVDFVVRDDGHHIGALGGDGDWLECGRLRTDVTHWRPLPKLPGEETT